jgi:hypothetical protein
MLKNDEIRVRRSKKVQVMQSYIQFIGLQIIKEGQSLNFTIFVNPMLF